MRSKGKKRFLKERVAALEARKDARRRGDAREAQDGASLRTYHHESKEVSEKGKRNYREDRFDEGGARKRERSQKESFCCCRKGEPRGAFADKDEFIGRDFTDSRRG